MQRLIGRIVVVVGCLVALLLLLPWAFSNAILRAPVIAQIEARTGLVTEQMGNVSISFLPLPYLKFKHLKLHDKTGKWMAEAHAVSGELRLSALLAGRLELKSLTLVQPRLAADVDAQPFGDASAIARALRLRDGSPDAIAADATSLGTLRIVAGTMRLRGRTRRADMAISKIDATLEWPVVGGPASLSGSAVWNGHRAALDATTASPLALLRGLPAQTTLRLRSDLGDLDAAGSFTEVPRREFTGTVRATTPSLREIGVLAGTAIPLPGPLEAAAIEGDGTLTAGKLWLTDAKVSLDGNAFEGSLAIFAAHGRAAISGTLATDDLRLDGIVAALPPLRAADGGWSRETFDLADLSRRELDLRISAAKARLGTLQLEDAAVSLLVKEGRLDVALADAKAYGGTLRGRVIGRLDPPNVEVKLDGSFANIDLAGLFAGARGGGWITGTASGAIALANAGRSPAAILAGLDGHGRVDVEAGELVGIDLEKALRRMQKRPLLAALEIRGGRTAFDQFKLDAEVVSGVARVREGHADGPATRIAFSGSANLAERSVDVKGLATQTGSSAKEPSSAPKFTFFLGGTWDAPYLEPDAASLIRQSGAAAPLFVSRHASIDDRQGRAAMSSAAAPLAVPWLAATHLSH